jgi:acylphosphatase
VSEERIHLHISGRVQGVCYRMYARSRAHELSLRGFVRNLPDGRVELVAEGPGEDLDALVAWCWEGPDWARVTNVSETRGPARGEFAAFDITY